MDQVIPSGPADKALEPGDVLLAIDGKDVTDFVSLEATLDAHVAHSIRYVSWAGTPWTTRCLVLCTPDWRLDVRSARRLSIERGGVPQDVTVTVQDLHAITPASFLSLSGGVLHALSYQIACSYAVPVVSGPRHRVRSPPSACSRTSPLRGLEHIGVRLRGRDRLHARHGGHPAQLRHRRGQQHQDAHDRRHGHAPVTLSPHLIPLIVCPTPTRALRV